MLDIQPRKLNQSYSILTPSRDIQKLQKVSFYIHKILKNPLSMSPVHSVWRSSQRLMHVQFIPYVQETITKKHGKQSAVLLGKILLTLFVLLKQCYRNQPIDLQCKSIDWFLYKCNSGLVGAKAMLIIKFVSQCSLRSAKEENEEELTSDSER